MRCQCANVVWLDLALAFLLTIALTGAAQSQTPSPDERAREIEQQMTDDEWFSLIISLLGPVPLDCPA